MIEDRAVGFSILPLMDSWLSNCAEMPACNEG